MKFKRFYKCSWCGNVFSPGKVHDSEKVTFYNIPGYEHICSPGQRGLADQVGIQEIGEDDDSTSSSPT